MKKKIKIILFIIIIVIILIFFKKNFSYESDQKNNDDSSIETSLSLENNNNNLIKNLTYEVIFDQNKKYIITADIGEIIYINSIEIVEMKNAKAFISSNNDNSLVIKSNSARYNTEDKNTKFFQNVKIEFMDNKIYSDFLDFNFQKNQILISGNVIYESLNSNLTADNIKINTITKHTEIYMNNVNDKIDILRKN